jgi:hypothetical protein
MAPDFVLIAWENELISRQTISDKLSGIRAYVRFNGWLDRLGRAVFDRLQVNPAPALGHADYKGLGVFCWSVSHVPFRAAYERFIDFHGYAIAA